MPRITISLVESVANSGGGGREQVCDLFDLLAE